MRRTGGDHVQSLVRELRPCMPHNKAKNKKKKKTWENVNISSKQSRNNHTSWFQLIFKKHLYLYTHKHTEIQTENTQILDYSGGETVGEVICSTKTSIHCKLPIISIYVLVINANKHFSRKHSSHLSNQHLWRRIQCSQMLQRDFICTGRLSQTLCSFGLG